MDREQQTSDRGAALQPAPLGIARTCRPGLKHRATSVFAIPQSAIRIPHSR